MFFLFLEEKYCNISGFGIDLLHLNRKFRGVLFYFFNFCFCNCYLPNSLGQLEGSFKPLSFSLTTFGILSYQRFFVFIKICFFFKRSLRSKFCVLSHELQLGLEFFSTVLLRWLKYLFRFFLSIKSTMKRNERVFMCNNRKKWQRLFWNDILEGNTFQELGKASDYKFLIF
jgi:hypothetical protein